MRIDGMDATTRVPEYSFERSPAPDQGQTVGQEPGQKVKAEQKYPNGQDAPMEPNERLVRMAVDKANKQMMSRETSLQFEAYDRTGDMIVRIIDTNTKEVIREIPSKKILDMVANMLEMAGLLVDERR